MFRTRNWVISICLALAAGGVATMGSDRGDAGFQSLFNGQDLTGWRIPEGDNGHWRVMDGVIDYDAKSEAKGDKSLWSERSYRDFVLRLDWRLKLEPACRNKNVFIVQPDGSHLRDSTGKEVKIEIDDVDSGIFLKRKDGKSQVNIWMWPVGSGEVYGYRMDRKMPPEVRAAVTPKKRMDKPRGEWNTFVITLKGDRLWVVLNGEEVISNAQLPGMPEEGPIALQHHGSLDQKTGQWTSPPSLIQFRNISIKELK